MTRKLLINSIILFVAVLGFVFLSALPTHAQTAQDEICKVTLGSESASFVNGKCVDGSGTSPEGLFEGPFKAIVNTLIFITGAVAVIMLIIGGFRYTVSAGDSNAIGAAKNTILYAIIGLIVALLAFSIVNFVLTRI